MTCHDKEIAARVLSYQELSAEDRVPVDSHVAECDECAQTFWALDRFVHRLHKSGAERRMGLIHPREEQIIQLAVDPKLLAEEERVKIRRHFEDDKCADCERIYWSVLKDEKENGSEPEERTAASFWQVFFLVWKKPAFALLLAFAVLQGIEISQIVSLKHQIQQREAEYNTRVANTNVAEASSPSEVASANQPAPAQTAIPQAATPAQDFSQKQYQEKTIADLRRKLETYLKPPADAAYVLLLSTGRGGDSVPATRLPDSKLFVILRANLSPELGQYKGYKLVLQDNSGKTVQSDQVTQLDGTLNYLIRKELLKPGSYTLQISGQDGAQEHYLVQFPFRIAATR